MKQLGTWLYVSHSILRPDEEAAAIAAIVNISRARNAALEVTGALAFAGGAFGQYLEGPTDSLAALRASILEDPRHKDVLTVDAGMVDQRLFANWSLAYSGKASYFGRILERVWQEQSNRFCRSGREMMRMLRELAGDQV